MRKLAHHTIDVIVRVVIIVLFADRLIKDKQEKDDAAARLSDDALDRDNARWLRK